jgi:hypothetical protein
MRIWICPLGCPVAARTAYGLPWSDADLGELSAATFTHTRWAECKRG